MSKVYADEFARGGVKKIIVKMSVPNTEDPVTQTHADVSRDKLPEMLFYIYTPYIRVGLNLFFSCTQKFHFTQEYHDQDKLPVFRKAHFIFPLIRDIFPFIIKIKNQPNQRSGFLLGIVHGTLSVALLIVQYKHIQDNQRIQPKGGWCFSTQNETILLV